MIDWASLPLHDIPVGRLVWPCHDLNPDHLHPEPGQPVTAGPIHVQALIDGSLFVHDGRHRAARALLRGDLTIPAHVHEGA